MKALLFAFSFLAFLSACNPGGSGSPGFVPYSTPPDGKKPPIKFTERDEFEARQGVQYSFQLGKHAQPSTIQEGWTWTAENLPFWLNFVPDVGEAVGVPPTFGVHENVVFRGQNGSQTQVIGPFTFTVKGDPLFEEQWHLVNTGQATFSEKGGTPQSDITFTDTMVKGLDGLGITIAISDTAIETGHEDLSGAFLSDFAKNYENNAPPPYTGSATPEDTEYHGTSVAGLIGARAWNNIGVRGVAPESNLVSLAFINSDQSLGVQIDQITGPFDIFNQSWGLTPTSPINLEQAYVNQLKTTATTSREGKGAIIVRAAGNNFDTCSGDNCWSENSNQDPYNSTPYAIVVGALNAEGIKASYSDSGSNIWISAPGGEFGTTAPALMTTDLMDCNRGKSNSKAVLNKFESGTETSNFACNYTSSFNGTSASTPVVSGAIALLLQANPKLSYRDVKHILATTAKKVDTNFAPWEVPIKSRQYSYEPGWTKNAAGIEFHNYYGFGAINVDQAIDTAKNYTSFLPPLKEAVLSDTFRNPIPDENADGFTKKVMQSQNFTIENVQLELEIYHTHVGDIGVEVVSPSGTRSILLNPMNTYSWYNDPDQAPFKLVLLSNAFYGESTNGEWSIRVLDALPADTGEWKSYKLRFFGH